MRNALGQFIKGSKINLGRKRTEEIKKSIGRASKKIWNEPGRKEQMSLRMKHNWQNSDFIKKMKKRKKLKGEENPSWKGGKTRTVSGYIWRYAPNHPKAKKGIYFPEHRLVIEKILNRYLLPSEHIHHLGARDDNRPEMLICFSSNSAHRRFHHNPLNVKPEEIIFDGRHFIPDKILT